MSKGQIISLGKSTIREWIDDNALRLGAALSYYTVFSLAPLLIIVIGIAGLAFGNDYARMEIMKQLQGLLGQQGAAAAGEMLRNASHPKTGAIATIVGLITILFGATGVVTELKSALNAVWNVDSSSGIEGVVKDRAKALGIVLAIGFLLLVSLVLSALITGISSRYGQAAIWEVINFIISIGVITVLFALIFKYLPDTNVEWRNVWIGAFVTSVLFTAGKTLTGIYIAKSSVASTYGAAGSLVIILVWVYYNSQILFIGAEFTQVYSRIRGDAPIKNEQEAQIVQDHQKQVESDQREENMQNEVKVQDKPSTRLGKIAYAAGYQMQRFEDAGHDLKKKAVMGKWLFRIVNFIGFKRSAKIGWKGYKLKKKLEGEDDPGEKS
jgi:membrane protein